MPVTSRSGRPNSERATRFANVTPNAAGMSFRFPTASSIAKGRDAGVDGAVLHVLADVGLAPKENERAEGGALSRVREAL